MSEQLQNSQPETILGSSAELAMSDDMIRTASGVYDSMRTSGLTRRYRSEGAQGAPLEATAVIDLSDDASSMLHSLGYPGADRVYMTHSTSNTLAGGVVDRYGVHVLGCEESEKQGGQTRPDARLNRGFANLETGRPITINPHYNPEAREGDDVNITMTVGSESQAALAQIFSELVDARPTGARPEFV